MSKQSWMLETRERLQSPPTRQLDSTATTTQVAFVPLYVDAKELWVILNAHRDQTIPEQSRIHFSGGATTDDEQPWEVVARIVKEAGIETRQILRLGELDEIETLSQTRLIPCVGAIPRPEQPLDEASTEATEIFSLPLSAFRDPRLIEDCEVTVDDRIAWMRIYHVGRRRLVGPVAQILENLIERLFDESTLA